MRTALTPAERLLVAEAHLQAMQSVYDGADPNRKEYAFGALLQAQRAAREARAAAVPRFPVAGATVAAV